MNTITETHMSRELLDKLPEWCKDFDPKQYYLVLTDDGESYFCHISQFRDDVPERGMVIEFALHTNKDGKQCCSNCLVVEAPEKRRNRY